MSSDLRAGRLLPVVAALLWATAATAQTAECFPAIEQSDPDGDGIFFEHITSAGLRDVRVSTTNLDARKGVTATSVVRAFGLAAGIWTEQGGGRPMRYRGETTVTDIPVWLDDCEAAGSIDSIVVVDPGSDPSGNTDTADIRMRCIDMFTPTIGLGWAFKLTIYAKDRAGNFNPWVNGANTLSAGQKDLVGTMVHELGHSYNLTHHSDVDAGDPEVQQDLRQKLSGTTLVHVGKRQLDSFAPHPSRAVDGSLKWNIADGETGPLQPGQRVLAALHYVKSQKAWSSAGGEPGPDAGATGAVSRFRAHKSTTAWSEGELQAVD